MGQLEYEKKLKVWDEDKDINSWKARLSRLMTGVMIISGVNTLYFIFATTIWWMVLMNGLLWALSLRVVWGYGRWKMRS